LKEALFRQMIHGRVRPLPGVLSWLDFFREAGLKMAVASSAPPANIDALLGELELTIYFDAIVSAFNLPGKPDPAVFLKAARLIQVEPAACLVIEDAIAGVQAAKAGGMKCLAVTNTVSADRLHAADLVLESLEQLTPQGFYNLFNRAQA